MYWQTARGKTYCGGFPAATSVGSFHSSRKGRSSSCTENTAQKRSDFRSFERALLFRSLCGRRFRKPFWKEDQMILDVMCERLREFNPMPMQEEKRGWISCKY